ncbi:hypothetical protein HELRODRAFT_103068 [Helobdella robusta]|uniref:Ubiquitin-activating enzyme E1 C-terminal domain-containing protein n=1 Tax=Helobdella robusta TaxID=6412 RepID=T1EDE1_HELRO|nr:hypothetical protein HELRODRAFT_103068 [Helobdella robusta]ESN94142.1 hypothetical protein HELRODRAFT_103068 [Helobdella robusta]
MLKLASAEVFLFGLGALGIEIAKNLVLAGVKTLTLWDQKIATVEDLGTQFFIREEDVGMKKTRSQASLNRLIELNAYVDVKLSDIALDNDVNDVDGDDDDGGKFEFLNSYQCVIVTELSLGMQLKINKFCRSRDPQIKFIAADIYGLLCWSFCDFGDSFDVLDPDGEEPKEAFISSITKSNPGIVSTMESSKHGFEDGDTVEFREMSSMSALNGTICQIKVISPNKFSIIDTTGDEYSSFSGGGVVKQVKVVKNVKFESLERQLKHPTYLTVDLGKFSSPLSIHLSMLTLHEYAKRCQLPSFRWLVCVVCVNTTFQNWADIDKSILRCCCLTSNGGTLPPLGAFLGGIVAQEVLKALCNKFTPIYQWLHFDAVELMDGSLIAGEQHDSSDGLSSPRYGSVIACIGKELMEKLYDIKLFLVGCGAIGCELLKNFALLGLGTRNGVVTITDYDLIEKSNLNRQFLFRSHHIQKPKSLTAASSLQQINPDMKIEAHQNKVGWETESTIYTDDFIQSQDVLVNALDNVEARKYMDSRSVTNQRPLLESGTSSTKGHVQVIVPFLTESYASQIDPQDSLDVPYCTLRSFPANMEHCIEWARDKFESMFTQKISSYNTFWSKYSLAEIERKLKNGEPMEHLKGACKVAIRQPSSWGECLTLARNDFEKFFNHKAKELLIAFPLDTKTNDGNNFWQLPKRPPSPLNFDPHDDLHFSFVWSCAHLYASISNIKDIGSKEESISHLKSLPAVQFVSKNKPIETDEKVKKPDKQQQHPSEEPSDDDLNKFAQLVASVKAKFGDRDPAQLKAESFEKDNDANHHIDFISAFSNLRGQMYGIERMDRLQIKKIAGRIVPAIATTTASVAALVAIELLKVVKKCGLSNFRNTFLNMALPVIVMSEPGSAKQTLLSNGMQYSIWDRWEVHGDGKMTLDQFMKTIKKKYKMEPVLVVQGMKLIYSLDMLVLHKKRLNQSLISLIKVQPNKSYADLVVSFKSNKLDENGLRVDESGPEIRFYIKK